MDNLYSSAAASGLAGWALAHPEFESSVNPITTRGANYAHQITATLQIYMLRLVYVIG